MVISSCRLLVSSRSGVLARLGWVAECAARCGEQPGDVQPVGGLGATGRDGAWESTHKGEDRASASGLDPVRVVGAEAEAVLEVADGAVQDANCATFRVTRAGPDLVHFA